MFDDDFLNSPEALAAAAANQAREDAETAALAAAAAVRKAARAQQARPGSRRAGDRRFVGVVRRGRTVLAECGHEHTNRDWTTGANGTSATDCARAIIAGAANPATAEQHANRLRNAWLALTTQAGFVAPASTIAAAKADAAAAADAYLAAVARIG